MKPSSRSSLIDLIDLSAGYEKKVLFDHLNLSLYASELVCFMGPNGVGKSTLLKTLGGLLKPLAGTLVLNGNSIIPEQLISLVLTDPVKASYMTVYDLVVFGRYPYLNWQLKLNSKDRELIENAIEQVGISHLKDQTVNTLSDGQKQMAMIARAIAQDTPVVILDEPTAHLDLNNRVEVMRLLKDLTRTMKKGILLATHELDLALQTADLIWLTGNSQNIITGIPEELVLQGAFDEIFKFKGFDLKTGKVQHRVFRSPEIRLSGEGHSFLWTRNLLERNGFAVTPNGSIAIAIQVLPDGVSWIVNDLYHFKSLVELLGHLTKS
jgi:iron complex transport system ATP-binding protein